LFSPPAAAALFKTNYFIKYMANCEMSEDFYSIGSKRSTEDSVLATVKFNSN
jgi:hypothetical protein